tara:strand:+ start:392 stop:1051 length:660 start_codon:yes stop_codon:yes gene_type:complete
MNKNINEYRVYGRTKGRKKIRNNNIQLLDKYKIDINKDINFNSNIILDIGSGYGESTLFLAKNKNNSLIISNERFKDGNLSLSKQLHCLNLSNVKIFDGNALEFIDRLEKQNCINEIWILFPDPWPKKRHNKRRLINIHFFKKIYNYLKKDANVFISSDSSSMIFSIIKNLYELKKLFLWENDSPLGWIYEIQELPRTKFFYKAKKSNRKPFFIKLRKL